MPLRRPCSKPPPGKTYELPDGNTVTVGLPRQLAPELLFRSDLIDSWRLSVASRTTANWTTHYNSGVIMRTTMPPAQPGGQPVHAVPPLQQMVYNALLSCSPEVRRELCGHGAWREGWEECVECGGGMIERRRTRDLIC